MASIFGFSLKKIKTFRGHDGQGLNADIYYKGTLVAYYTDLADGGEPDIDFISAAAEPLKEQMKNSAAKFGEKFAPRYWVISEWTFDTKLSMIVDELMNLINLEKAYKSAVKKNNGKEVMFILPVFAIDNPKNITGTRYYPCNNTSEADKSRILKQLDKEYPDAIGYDIYKSLKCFDIN